MLHWINQGKYDVYNKPYIQLLINKFSREERKRVMEDDYETCGRNYGDSDSLMNDHTNPIFIRTERQVLRKLVQGYYDTTFHTSFYILCTTIVT